MSGGRADRGRVWKERAGAVIRLEAFKPTYNKQPKWDQPPKHLIPSSSTACESLQVSKCELPPASAACEATDGEHRHISEPTFAWSALCRLANCQITWTFCVSLLFHFSARFMTFHQSATKEWRQKNSFEWVSCVCVSFQSVSCECVSCECVSCFVPCNACAVLLQLQ